MKFRRTLKVKENGDIQIVDQSTGEVVWEGSPDDLAKYTLNDKTDQQGEHDEPSN